MLEAIFIVVVKDIVDNEMNEVSKFLVAKKAQYKVFLHAT